MEFLAVYPALAFMGALGLLALGRWSDHGGGHSGGFGAGAACSAGASGTEAEAGKPNGVRGSELAVCPKLWREFLLWCQAGRGAASRWRLTDLCFRAPRRLAVTGRGLSHRHDLDVTPGASARSLAGIDAVATALSCRVASTADAVYRHRRL